MHDPIYDDPDARWPEVPHWRTWLAVGITLLAALLVLALTKAWVIARPPSASGSSAAPATGSGPEESRPA
jgi:hypothetical protein